LLSVVPRNRMPPIHTVVLDVGGALIDWNPRYLYRTIISEGQELERFPAYEGAPRPIFF